MNRRTLVLVAVVLAASGSLAQSPPAALAADPLGTLEAEASCPLAVRELKRLSDCHLHSYGDNLLDTLVAAADDPAVVELPVLGTTVALALGPSTVFTEEALASAPHLRPLEGWLADDPSRFAALTVDTEARTLSGVVALEDGYVLVEPVTAAGPLHVTYLEGEVDHAGLPADGHPPQGGPVARPAADGGLPGRPEAHPAVPVAGQGGEEGNSTRPEPGQAASDAGEAAGVSVAASMPIACDCRHATSVWIHAYYDVTNPLSLLNSLMGPLYVENIRIRVVAITPYSWDTATTVDTCTTGGANDLLERFANDPTTAVSSGVSDRAMLFTNQPSSAFTYNFGGCGYIPGTHAWVRYLPGLADGGGTNIQFSLVTAMHEFGHNLGANHLYDTTRAPVNHIAGAHGCSTAHAHEYTSAMDDRLSVCERTREMNFLPYTEAEIATELANMPYRWAAFHGPAIDPAHTTLKLDHWYTIYPETVTTGSVLVLGKWYSTTVGTLPVKLFYGARSCSTSSVAGGQPCPATSTPNRDFAQYTPATLSGTQLRLEQTYTMPSGLSGLYWTVWPAHCHVHSTVCTHYGPFAWQGFRFYVN